MELIRVRKSKLSLDMAPLIDVVFQLLIFFMLTASFSNPAMRLNLPKAVTKDQSADEQLVVNVRKSGDIFINDKKVSLASLKGELAVKLAKYEKKSVNIKGEEDMPYKYFVEVMDLARQAGATQVNIVHQGK